MSGNSPAPGTPQTGTKAYVASAISFLAIFVGIWVADVDPFTGKEVAAAIVTALIGSGITGGTAYAVKNTPTT